MRCVANNHTSVHCRVTLPLSKSILNRLLVIRHLSGSESFEGILSDASDVLAMHNLLLAIRRNSGNPNNEIEINTGNAGTVMRFLTSVLALTPGKWMLTGTGRMQKRPIKPLTDALQSLGAEIAFLNMPGFPPMRISGRSKLTGGTVRPDAAISSQFISSLMMIGPLLEGGLTIEFQGIIISGSYISMTQSLMQKAGAEVNFDGNKVIITEGSYKKNAFPSLAEPDWSSAAYWYEVASFAQEAEILLKGLSENSVQGDSVLPSIYANLGVSTVFTNEGVLLTKSGSNAATEFDYDFTDCPDLAQPVIVSCAALGVKSRFTGLKTLRIKETDRIAALQIELTRLGYGLEVNGDEILLDGRIQGVQNYNKTVVINCYDDHRMAMSFTPLALLHGNISLNEPDVVKKSYPGFWKDMEMAGFYFVK